jgi:hypothetical protein
MPDINTASPPENMCITDGSCLASSRFTSTGSTCEKADDKEEDGMALTSEQQDQIESAIKHCDIMDKSTEFTLQYAADWVGCEVEDVVEYLAEKAQKEKPHA